MEGRNFIEFEHRQIIEEGLKQGKNYKEIWLHPGLQRFEYSTIKGEILRRGGRKNYTALAAQAHRQEKLNSNNYSKVRKFTEAEAKLIKKCVAEGHNRYQICCLLGCGYYTLNRFFAKHNLSIINRRVPKKDRFLMLEKKVDFLLYHLKNLTGVNYEEA